MKAKSGSCTVKVAFAGSLLLIQWRARDFTIENNLKDLMLSNRERLLEIEKELVMLRCPPLPLSALCHNSAIYENMDLYDACKERRALLIEQAELECTNASIEHIIGKNMVFTLESMTIDSLDKGSVPLQNQNTNENVSDYTGGEVKNLDAGSSMSLNNGQEGFLAIEDFLDRPIEIATGTIAVGAHLSAIYPIWDLLTKHPSVRAKIKNFGFLRANLKVRIAISGSPFHMGRVLLSYQPHAGKNANLIAHAANLAVDSTYRPMLINYLSQAPGAVLMDVRANEPVEMSCPFISVKPMGRLFNASSSAIAAATSFTDFVDMGSLYVYTISTIGSVSASSASSLGYSIFAWLEDVQLTMPTATQLAITTESKMVSKTSSKDERDKGPIETMSSAMADLAMAACTIPVLEPYALPATIVFNAINAAASHYGWSRPSVVQPVSFVKNRPHTNSAVCIGSESVDVLSYDPKRELCVDSLACASETDDLCITTIATRESYFETWTWAAADPAYTAKKAYIVHPQLNSYYVDAGATPCTMVQPTAMSFAATPMCYWRGDIIFRIDIATSQYHRGKLAIWYEPNHHHESLISADLALNKNDIQIIDIAVTNSVEIVVKWGSSFPWLKTIAPTSIKPFHNPSILTLNLTDSINGHIIIAPFVPLQSPDGSSVNVHMFARAENLLLQELGGTLPTERKYITPQSKNISDAEVTTTTLNPSTASVKDITKHYFGEAPFSYRSCLKRYVTTGHVTYTTTGAHEKVSIQRLILPQPFPIYNGTTNPAEPNLYAYLRYAYLGLRGSIRTRLRCIEPAIDTHMTAMVVTLLKPATSLTETAGEANSPAVLYQHGSVTAYPHIQGPIEFEIPFYTQNNFIFSFATDCFGTSVDGEVSLSMNRGFLAELENRGAASEVFYWSRDFAVGEDFTLMRFQGAPYYTY